MLRDPFALDEVPAPARAVVDWALALGTCRGLYRKVQNEGDDAGAFETRVLASLNIEVDAARFELDRIPRHGPLVVAANHPHGILDGLVLMAILRRIRPDTRLVANRLLARIPELREFCFFVDPFDNPTATARSLGGLRAAHLWLRSGGALVLFPAGEVAHGPVVDGVHADSPWKPTVARLAETTGAHVLPARIAGANTRLFYAAGKIHPALRTVLLAREFLKKRGARIGVRFGVPEPAAHHRSRAVPSVAPAFNTAVVADEVEQLPGEACLAESGSLQVFCADAAQIPVTLCEIGRLREKAYRAVGEGTGRRLDIDTFDARYLHLFLWDRDRRRVAGAYRIGRTDEIVTSQGVTGLYTRTLFRYDQRLLSRIGAPTLELGRSFVCAEYQKTYNALLMLWKGIGQYVARHPHYRYLLGAVSISAQYSDTSHRLLMEFLRQNHLDRDLAVVVDAINPSAQVPAPDAAALVPQSIDEVNRLVAEAERDGKGVPVLLRQYLKLNARLIGFNTDPAFGDALDALMIVDLAAVDPSILARYLGRERAAAFLASHRAQDRAA